MEDKEYTLEEARNYVRENLQAGVKCPCCDQFAKVYKRKINSFMSQALILINNYFSKSDAEEWLHVPSYLVEVGAKDRECAKLRYWGLIEEKESDRGDGSKHSGYYKITEVGKKFAKGLIKIPKYVYLYDGQLQDFGGEYVTIQETLKEHFSFSELMSTPES
jgi:hypothetical protein